MDLPIRTERLVLRASTMDDLDDHWRMYSDPAVVRYLYQEVMDRDQAADHLRERLLPGLPAEGEWRNWAVEHDGCFVGDVGLRLVSVAHQQCEIGYVFLPEAAGHGYATEAAAAVVDIAFDELHAHRVAGHLDARNEASARVLQRLGMRLEAHLRENEFIKGEWTDELIYAVTRDEWASSRRR